MKKTIIEMLPVIDKQPRIAINIAFIMLISACVPPTTSEVKTDKRQETSYHSVVTGIPDETTKPAELPQAENTDAGTVTQEVQETRGFDRDPMEKLPDAPVYKSPEYNEDVTVVAAQNAPVLRERGAAAVKEQNILYDQTNEMYGVLQKANESMAGFPVNRVGEVDWVNAMKQGLINPRTTRTGHNQRETRDNDIIMKNTKEMPNVRFPHSTHTYWLDCTNCHDKIFVPKTGANQINMYKIFNGQFCGVCHNKVAFTTYMCETCHSVNQKPDNTGNN